MSVASVSASATAITIITAIIAIIVTIADLQIAIRKPGGAAAGLFAFTRTGHP
jgi:hypothetical protein